MGIGKTSSGIAEKGFVPGSIIELQIMIGKILLRIGQTALLMNA
ncbi:hypothetical protein ES703_83000 [subsurface metagenome]